MLISLCLKTPPRGSPSRTKKHPSPHMQEGVCDFCTTKGERLDLLDRREDPGAGAAAAEGPEFRDLRGPRRISVDDLAGGAIDHPVVERIPHGDRGVFGAALAPGFG